MTGIDDLPPEILIKLFKYLTPEDRRIASLVCRYWSYEIWMESIFDHDRILNFDHCEFLTDFAPSNVFINTKREFKRLVFGKDAKFKEKIDREFLNGNLKGVISLEFKPFFNYAQLISCNKNFLEDFENLKELKMNVGIWDSNEIGFEKLPDPLEIYNLVLLDEAKSTFDCFKCMIWNMKNLKELNLKCQLLTDDLFDFITTSNLPVLKKLDVRIDSNTHLNLKKLRCPNVTELFLTIEDAETVQILDEVIVNFPSLVKIKLHTYRIMPRSVHAHLIKYLKVTDINCGMDFVKPLEHLTSLEELDLHYYFKSVAQGNCFFSHDPYLNSHLKRLRLCGFNNNDLISLMCFENLVKSFPNLESIVMDMPLSSQHLQMIHQYFTKLKCLDIRNTDVDSRYVPPLKYFENLSQLRLDQYIITDETLREWPEMLHLRVFSMKLDHDYTLDNFQKMIYNIRQIEYISFNHTSIICDGLIKVVADNCKRLKQIRVRKSQNTKNLTMNSVSYLKRKCLYLKVIDFPFIEIFNVPQFKINELV